MIAISVGEVIGWVFLVAEWVVQALFWIICAAVFLFIALENLSGPRDIYREKRGVYPTREDRTRDA